MTPEQIEELADNLKAAKKHDAADDWLIENRHIIARQVLAQAAEIERLKSCIDQLEQDFSNMRDNADSAYRHGYWAGENGA